ncbi:MAG: hypothetical protein LUD50_07815 [Clostridia bacterium]|nr:hypothetical protein [Clostridia bacterium]
MANIKKSTSRFDIDINAQIFNELRDNPPLWWMKFKERDDLYIEVRKGNEVHVYYEGGKVAGIRYSKRKKKFVVHTHRKYLGITAPKPTYVECSDTVGADIDSILKRIEENYSKKRAVYGVVQKESWSEKYIQGELILKYRDIHLDSEFAFNDGKRKVRIDLVKSVNGAITFVELKRIKDGRMLHITDYTNTDEGTGKSKDAGDNDIKYQMEKYADFIRDYKKKILCYYQQLYDIKKSLSLPVPDVRPESVNATPELLIFNLWEKKHHARDKRLKGIEDKLDRRGITYKIKSEL